MAVTSNQALDEAFGRFQKALRQKKPSGIDAGTNPFDDAWPSVREKIIQRHFEDLRTHLDDAKASWNYVGDGQLLHGLVLHGMDGTRVPGGVELMFQFEPSRGQVIAQINVNNVSTDKLEMCPVGSVDGAWVRAFISFFLDEYAERAS